MVVAFAVSPKKRHKPLDQVAQGQAAKAATQLALLTKKNTAISSGVYAKLSAAVKKQAIVVSSGGPSTGVQTITVSPNMTPGSLIWYSTTGTSAAITNLQSNTTSSSSNTMTASSYAAIGHAQQIALQRRLQAQQQNANAQFNQQLSQLAMMQQMAGAGLQGHPQPGYQQGQYPGPAPTQGAAGTWSAGASRPGAGPDFNRYLNASDMIEEFIKYVGGLGLGKREFLSLPVELFIAFLVVRAAESDGEVPPADQVKRLTNARQEIKLLPSPKDFVSPAEEIDYLYA